MEELCLVTYQVRDQQKSDTLLSCFSNSARTALREMQQHFLLTYRSGSDFTPSCHDSFLSGRYSLRLNGIETLDLSAGCVLRIVIPPIGKRR